MENPGNEDCSDVAEKTKKNCKSDNLQRSNSSSPEQNDSRVERQDDQLETTRAEMGEVKEENERLKSVLERMTKDYQALQTRLAGVIHEEQTKKASKIRGREKEDDDLVSLSLGSRPKIHREGKKSDLPRELEERGLPRENLSLALNSRFNGGGVLSLEEEELGRRSKSPKTMPISEDDDFSQRNPLKSARVSIRSRCDTPTMNDGCQWRKYGQKVSKGNPCPRAYYRCTVAPSCPVRKQVQRCAEDMSILITTYEGTHNHPLPSAAAAMASTTAAAASMIMSGASVSASTAAPFAPSFLSNPSISSFSSNPTITLDLTSKPSPSPSVKQFSANPYLSYTHGRNARETEMRQIFFQRRSDATPQVQQNPLGGSIAAATKAITSDPSFQSALAVAISSMVGGQGSRGSADPLEQVKMLKWADKLPPRGDLSGGGSSYYSTRTSSLNSIQHQARAAASDSASASTIDCGDNNMKC